MRYAPPDAEILVREGSSRLYVSWTAVDADSFRDVKDSFRAAFPRHGDATWCPAERAWSIPAYLRLRLERWLAEHADPERVQWERQSSRYERQERPQQRTPATLASALRTLHLTPDAPLELAEHVYRWHAKHAHPDAGGSHAAAVAINAAIEIIRDYAPEGAA